MAHREQADSSHVSIGGLVALSGSAVHEFLAAVVERDADFRFAARGFSMYPFIKDGDVITVSPLRAHGLRVGEVAAFRSGEDRLVIHRVIAAKGVEYEVRGDNCPHSDAHVPAESILGVVTRVERRNRPTRLGIGPGSVVIAGLSRRGILRPLVWRTRTLLRPVVLCARRAIGLARSGRATS